MCKEKSQLKMSCHQKQTIRASLLLSTLPILFSSCFIVNGAVVNTVETLVERTVALPCVATQHPVGDTPILLLFYRQPSNIPFFSYDARSGDFWRQGNSKTRDDRYEGRIYLNLTQPRRVHLSLEHVSVEDAGDFTCRVDFVSSPSLTSIVKLKVFANPALGPTISVGMGPRGTLVNGGEVGPFHEGKMLNLSCTVTGGFPVPTVTWWQDVKLVDNSSYVVSSSGPLQIVNDLMVGPLTRSLIRKPFTCRSENNPLSAPLDKTINVKIHMAPQRVILPEAATVRAGLEERLQCRAEGAYPEANITWYLNGKPLNFTAKETQQIGSDTISWIRFIASPDQNKATLSCTGSSATLPVPPVSTNVTLNVTHEPQVRLKLGSSLKPDHIRQGDDVYFDCHTEANPPVQRISWYKEENEVRHNQLSGVIVGGTNLVLQDVQRSDAGSYSCRATNSVASISSNSLTLGIQYGPMCAQGRVTVTAVEGEVVTLRCRVDAYPSNVTFYWLFNNTVDSTRFRKNEYTTEGLESNLRYVAYSARDYGTVFCWAANAVGRQVDPCAFTLQPAGAPDSVYDCVLTNQSAGSLRITCKPGADGGLTQTFRATVFAAGVKEPVRVLEGMSPAFTVEGLAPGEDYVITLTAINRKGVSPPVSLEAYTLKVAENRMISGVSSSQPEPEEGPSGAVSPLLGVFLGIVGAFLLLAVAAIFITKRHCSRGSGSTPDLVAGQELDAKDERSEPCASRTDTTTQRTHGSTETPDLTENDPFLMSSVRSSGTGSTPTSGGACVFTIPTHIPPPPQYCSSTCTELPPNRHTLDQFQTIASPSEHPMQHTSKCPVTQHILHQVSAASSLSLHTSSPKQHRLQRSSSVERCGVRGVIAQTPAGHMSPTQWSAQHGTQVTFAVQSMGHPSTTQLGVAHQDGAHHIMGGSIAEGIDMGCSLVSSAHPSLVSSAHPSPISYGQPLPGIQPEGREPIAVLSGAIAPTTTTLAMGSRDNSILKSVHSIGASPPHMTRGLAPSHLAGAIPPGGAPRSQVVSFVGEQRLEQPTTYESPKSRAKHVTWKGGSTHGEESAV